MTNTDPTKIYGCPMSLRRVNRSVSYITIENYVVFIYIHFISYLLFTKLCVLISSPFIVCTFDQNQTRVSYPSPVRLRCGIRLSRYLSFDISNFRQRTDGDLVKITPTNSDINLLRKILLFLFHSFHIGRILRTS